MKKILMLAACTAAMTAITSCSSNDDDVLPQATVAPAAGESVAEGTPLVIKMADITRGTDWTAKTLPSISLYTIGGTDGATRWLGTKDSNGSSIGQFFKGDGDGNLVSGILDGTDFSPSSIQWEDGSWDFYALSNADDSHTFNFAQTAGGEDLEDLARPTGRNFSYTVPTDYNTQQDLLVGAALNKEKGGGDVTIPFYHALAQIGQITLNFADLGVDNSSFFFVIKSITIHGLKSTGKYTFPDTWANDTYNNGTWSNQTAEAEYHIELPQFDLDDNGNYKIFEEIPDTDPFENESTGFATGTKRGGITTLPNFFHAPASGASSYVLPLAKKVGSEGAQQTTPYDISTGTYTPNAATYTVDGGLYIIPQSLDKTVWEKNGSDEVTGVTNGVYAEIRGIMFNLANTGNWATLDENIVGADGDWLWQFTNINNAEITQILNHEDYIGSYLVPLVSNKKELKAGKRYNLTFEMSQAVTIESGACVFDGAEIQ